MSLLYFVYILDFNGIRLASSSRAVRAQRENRERKHGRSVEARQLRSELQNYPKLPLTYVGLDCNANEEEGLPSTGL